MGVFSADAPNYKQANNANDYGSNFFDRFGNHAADLGRRGAKYIPSLLAMLYGGGGYGGGGAIGGSGGGGGGGDDSGGGNMSMFSGITDGLGGLLGLGLGGQQLSKSGQGFQPTGMPQADQWWQQLMPLLMSRQQGVSGMIDPQFMNSYLQMLGIDPSGMTRAGATAGQEFGALAGEGQRTGAALEGAGMADIGRGNDIWQRAADPMNAQHDFERHNVMENVRGAESARGIAMGAQGSGLEADALGKFDIDWKNFQDNRMLNANTAANQANFGARQDFGQSMNIGSQVPGFTMNSAAAPIAGQEATAGFPAHAAAGFAQNMYGSDPYAAILSQIGNYMGNTFGVFGASPQFRANQTQAGYGNIAGALPGLSNMFSGLFGGGGGGGDVGWGDMGDWGGGAGDWAL